MTLSRIIKKSSQGNEKKQPLKNNKIIPKEKTLSNGSKSNLESKVYTEYVFRVKYLNIATRVFLIRSRHGGPDKIISSSLPFIHNIRKEVDK